VINIITQSRVNTLSPRDHPAREARICGLRLVPPPLEIHPHIMAASHGDLRHLLPGNYKHLISEWLEEDCPSLDYGGFVVGETEGEARLLGKSNVSLISTR